MKKTVTLDEAADGLRRYSSSWSHAGARALIEYLIDYEDDIGEELEFDPVAFDMEFSEYESMMDYMKETGSDQGLALDAVVAKFDGGVVIHEL